MGPLVETFLDSRTSAHREERLAKRFCSTKTFMTNSRVVTRLGGDENDLPFGQYQSGCALLSDARLRKILESSQGLPSQVSLLTLLRECGVVATVLRFRPEGVKTVQLPPWTFLGQPYPYQPSLYGSQPCLHGHFEPSFQSSGRLPPLKGLTTSRLRAQVMDASRINPLHSDASELWGLQGLFPSVSRLAQAALEQLASLRDPHFCAPLTPVYSIGSVFRHRQGTGVPVAPMRTSLVDYGSFTVNTDWIQPFLEEKADMDINLRRAALWMELRVRHAGLTGHIVSEILTGNARFDSSETPLRLTDDVSPIVKYDPVAGELGLSLLLAGQVCCGLMRAFLVPVPIHLSWTSALQPVKIGLMRKTDPFSFLCALGSLCNLFMGSSDRYANDIQLPQAQSGVATMAADLECSDLLGKVSILLSGVAPLPYAFDHSTWLLHVLVQLPFSARDWSLAHSSRRLPRTLFPALSVPEPVRHIYAAREFSSSLRPQRAAEVVSVPSVSFELLAPQARVEGAERWAHHRVRSTFVDTSSPVKILSIFGSLGYTRGNPAPLVICGGDGHGGFGATLLRCGLAAEATSFSLPDDEPHQSVVVNNQRNYITAGVCPVSGLNPLPVPSDLLCPEIEQWMSQRGIGEVEGAVFVQDAQSLPAEQPEALDLAMVFSKFVGVRFKWAIVKRAYCLTIPSALPIKGAIWMRTSVKPFSSPRTNDEVYDVWGPSTPSWCSISVLHMPPSVLALSKLGLGQGPMSFRSTMTAWKLTLRGRSPLVSHTTICRRVVARWVVPLLVLSLCKDTENWGECLDLFLAGDTWRDSVDHLSVRSTVRGWVVGRGASTGRPTTAVIKGLWQVRGLMETDMGPGVRGEMLGWIAELPLLFS
eukprot:GHVN01016989.1.p1 GENE.GHVN01016989.1~~GHVN01016989.1.p1  ORF type:complete len:997 (+),score=26.98 GHVN01016989.1:373-2991(+)